MKNECRDRETRRRQNHDEISHDFLGLMVEICDPLKIAETQAALPLPRMSCCRLTTGTMTGDLNNSKSLLIYSQSHL